VEPQPVRGLVAKAKALALGEKHSCALLTDGSVWCWGAREAMGSDTQGGLIPVRVPLPAASSMLVASFDRTCAQLSNGSFYCWGEEPERLNFPIN
jgi:alpha-tubulin suppressor-like RCC1 family protein